MKVFFKPSFIKDFACLSPNTKKEVKKICLTIFPKQETPFDFKEYKIKKLKGKKGKI